jgi:DNA-directed RNA polymerase subunit RPC12/RpoP/uncharacterized membrane protein
MPIEFRCSRCQRLLRTADDTAGKQTKCPECGAVLMIPAPPPSGAPLPMTPRPAAPSNSPSPPMHGAAPSPANPFMSPGGQPFGTPMATAGPGTLDVGEVLGATWAIYSQNVGTLVVGMLLLILIYLIATVPFALIFGIGIAISIGLTQAGNEAAGVLVGVVAIGLGILALLAFIIWVYAGTRAWLLKIGRGQGADFGALFSGSAFLLPMIVGILLFSLMFLVGEVLCVIPAFFVMFIFGQFSWLIVDRRLGPIQALVRSQQITSGNWLNLFLLFLVTFGISLINVTVVASLFVIPFLGLMKAVTYLRLTGQPTAEMLYSAPHPPMRHG